MLKGRMPAGFKSNTEVLALAVIVDKFEGVATCIA